MGGAARGGAALLDREHQAGDRVAGGENAQAGLLRERGATLLPRGPPGLPGCSGLDQPVRQLWSGAGWGDRVQWGAGARYLNINCESVTTIPVRGESFNYE